MPAIVVEQLTKVFRAGRPLREWARAPWGRGEPVLALDEVSFTVEAGELFCVMGANGAGKTTLLKILAGLVLPTQGCALIEGCDVTRGGAAVRSVVGWAGGDPPGFYDRLTGRENLAFFGALYGLRGARAAGRIDELIDLLALDGPDQRYQEYAAGIKQRWLLARALLHQPRILLLDEPTRSLDPDYRERLYGLLEQLCARGTAIVLTTHHLEEARRLARRIAVLEGGELGRLVQP